MEFCEIHKRFFVPSELIKFVESLSAAPSHNSIAFLGFIIAPAHSAKF